MGFEDNYTTPCQPCYEYTLPACADSTESFIIKGGLTADTEYDWYVEDKFGKVFHDTATTNGDGDIEIPLLPFPDGYFTPYSGVFSIYFKLGDEETEVESLTFGVNDYECIKLSFRDIDSDNLTIE